MSNKNSTKPEWEKHYQTLERIRQSGITNMFGAAPYLAAMDDIPEKLALDILGNWMRNYDELCKKYGWRN